VIDRGAVATLFEDGKIGVAARGRQGRSSQVRRSVAAVAAEMSLFHMAKRK
jgi:hypothetical protein